MPAKSFWVAAIAAVLGTVGLAMLAATLWSAEGAMEGTVSGSLLGSVLTLVGFALLLGQRPSSLGVFGLFFLLKIIALAGGAAFLWKFPQFGRHEYYMAGFLGGALLGSMVGAFFLWSKSSLKRTQRV